MNYIGTYAIFNIEKRGIVDFYSIACSIFTVLHYCMRRVLQYALALILNKFAKYMTAALVKETSSTMLGNDFAKILSNCASDVKKHVQS